MGDDGADVTGEEVFVAANAEEQRAAAARADDEAGMRGVDDGDAVGADNFFEGVADGFGEVAVGLFIMVADEVGEDFGVGLGGELVALGDEAVFEELMVFDDAVVDEGELAGLVEVRMGVGVGGRAMGGPAGVADANGAGDGLFAEEAGEFIDAAGFFAEFKLAVVQRADAGGIIAAVFEPAEALQ